MKESARSRRYRELLKVALDRIVAARAVAEESLRPDEVYASVQYRKALRSLHRILDSEGAPDNDD